MRPKLALQPKNTGYLICTHNDKQRRIGINFRLFNTIDATSRLISKRCDIKRSWLKRIERFNRSTLNYHL